jgi:hypothetical protein
MSSPALTHGLHNMSLAPRSTVVIAPGRSAAPRLTVSLDDPPAKALANLGFRTMDERAIEELTRMTAARLAEVEVPAAAAVVPGSGRPLSEPLLAIAILSRCNPTLFLRSRTPRFDLETLGRPLSFATDALGPNCNPSLLSRWFSR